MFPQRDALSTLAIEDLPWLSERDRSQLREATDRITRLAEELDAIRERAAVVQDQLVERRAEAMNHNMMILAVVAAVFLPLGLLTGLLGINVGGMPGAGDQLGLLGRVWPAGADNRVPAVALPAAKADLEGLTSVQSDRGLVQAADRVSFPFNMPSSGGDITSPTRKMA